MNLDITVKNQNQLILNGRIDTLTCQYFEDTLLPLISEEVNHLTLDCTKVNYISSTGLRVFILADKKVQSFNGEITIIGLDDFLKNIFDISGLTALFNFV